VVVFDVGETLVSEERVWGGWADWLGVSRLTLFAALGAVIRAGENHRRVFELVRPGIDFEAERGAKEAAGIAWTFTPQDVYPDAAACLARLRADGYRIGIAANQPAQVEAAMPAIGLAADFVATSDGWGVEKPSPAFFERIVEIAGADAVNIAYVGDRVDNDVLPAKNAGMFAVFLRRGPWGFVHASLPEVARADARIDSLDELPGAFRAR
jgi:FMN phosphatase YigB (HAD superfamily)